MYQTKTNASAKHYHLNKTQFRPPKQLYGPVTNNTKVAHFHFSAPVNFIATNKQIQTMRRVKAETLVLTRMPASSLCAEKKKKN